MLESLIQWAGVIDELEFAKMLSLWCKNGFPELGDKRGFQFSETIDKVSMGTIGSLPITYM